MALPDEVLDLCEFSPIEDFLIPLLRAHLPAEPAIFVRSLISMNEPLPCVLMRRLAPFGSRGDPRFVDSTRVSMHSYAEGADGDVDAAQLGEACRVILRDAWLHQEVVAGRGHISQFRTVSAPRRVSDWAPSTGPVQYADLPVGVYRYEAIYDLEIRRYIPNP